jgi:hypothetical protein
MLKTTLLLASFICFASFKTVGQPNISLHQIFFRLLNDYNKDSLEIITTDNFELKEAVVSKPYSKKEFLDSFLIYSKAINGKFKILNTISNREPMVFTVADVTDYTKYFNIEPVVWKMTITTSNRKIKKIITDTTSGFKKYIESFDSKHSSFLKWLILKYPNENEQQLFTNQKGLLSERLKQYANSKK